MALVHDDFVQETSTTTGTGTYTLAGNTAGHQAFSAIGDGNTCLYSATDGTNWETGVGTYTSAGTTLARTTVLTSSNGDAAVNWGAGTRKISCVLPSAKRSVPSANDTEALGTATVSWADLFLASGGVINWNNGNVTLTHAAGKLTLAGNLDNSTSGIISTGTIELGHASDTTLARVGAGDISVEGNTVYRVGGTDAATADGGTGSSISVVSGDIIYGNGTGTMARLAKSTDGAILTLASGLPAWGALRGYIDGCILSNGTDATNDIDVTAGVCCDTTAVSMMKLAALTKQLDAAWAVGTNQGGLDTGSIGNSWYHMWVIQRSDTGVVDMLFSLSATAPTMPTSYDRKCRIGAVKRTAAALVAFTQVGDEFRWKTPIKDIDVTNPGTSAVSRTLTVATGIKVWANIVVHMNNSTGSVGIVLSSLDDTDIAASATSTVPSTAAVTIGALNVGTSLTINPDTIIRTNTSGQIRSRNSGSGASDELIMWTRGWWDPRGRDA